MPNKKKGYSKTRGSKAKTTRSGRASHATASRGRNRASINARNPAGTPAQRTRQRSAGNRVAASRANSSSGSSLGSRVRAMAKEAGRGKQTPLGGALLSSARAYTAAKKTNPELFTRNK